MNMGSRPGTEELITVHIPKPLKPTWFTRLDTKLEELKSFLFSSGVSLTAKFNGNSLLQSFYIRYSISCAWNAEMLEKVQVVMSFK